MRIKPFFEYIMNPRIEELENKLLIGMHLTMSLADNRTAELWQSFMLRHRTIKNRKGTDFISLQNYGNNWNFSPTVQFKKWALVEVTSLSKVPPAMEPYTLKGGMYAVFSYQGPASAAGDIMKAIFTEWLPESPYELDNRDHFEILPQDYKPTDPEAKEEIWIPVKKNT